MEYKFNGEGLLEENIEKAREFYIQLSRNCIEGAKKGEFFVNDLDKYVEWQMKSIERLNTNDNFWLGFFQTAYYFQTGKSIALLP